MASVDKDIERLMVRKLDGELGKDEELRLNRELIRNPDAHSLMEAYERIDGLAGAALNEALGQEHMPLNPADLPSRSSHRTVTRSHRGWWLVPGAIAAALLAIVVARFPLVSQPGSAVVDSVPTEASRPFVSGPHAGHSDGLMQTVGTDRVRRSMGRDIIGVIGDDGNIYWIEVDRLRTIKWPKSGSTGRNTAEEL